MTERGFHPFAVLHFLRKTILLYLLPLLQVLFARNWAALRTALVQGAVLLAVIAAVSAAVLHTSRWQVDEHGTLRVCWRLGVRLDRCLKAGQLAALTIERPLLYRLAGASRVVLYPAGQKRTLTLLLNAQDAQLLADRMMPRRDAVAHTPRGGETVSYTHLTLPTKRIVEISGGGVTLKKKKKRKAKGRADSQNKQVGDSRRKAILLGEVYNTARRIE